MSDNPFLLPGAGRRDEPAAPEPVAEETRFDPLPTPSPGSWRLVLPGGESHPLTGTVILGRDPIIDDSDSGAVPLAVDDPGRSVSKTHAVITVRDGAVLVRDLHSTNGTVVSSGSRQVRVGTDRESPVPPGAIVELGSYVIRVELG